MNKHEYFKTNDLCLASFLLAKNISFVGLNKDSAGKADFVFRNNKDCKDLVGKFSSLDAVVEPMAFFSAQKRLKHLLYL